MDKLRSTAVLLIVVLVGQHFNVGAQTPEEKQSAIRQQLVMIPAGSIVQVTLLQKGSSKIKGKLLSVKHESFEVQTVKSGEVSSQTFAFLDVKSVKAKGTMRATTKVLVVAGFVALGLLVAGLIFTAAGGVSN